MQIRLARADDYPAIEKLARALHDLHVRLVPGTFAPVVGPMLAQAGFTESLSDPKQRPLVAEADGAVVGYTHVALIACGPVFAFDFSASISQFVIDESCRRHGIGKALMHAAEAWAAEQGATYLTLGVTLENETAFEFYRAQGMAVEAYRMRKRIGTAAKPKPVCG